MSRLPSWTPVLAATAGSIAAAWYLPQWGAIAAVAVLFSGTVAWPAIRGRCQVWRELRQRRALRVPAAYPERIASRVPRRQRRHFARWHAQMWPHSEHHLIVDEERRREERR